MLNALNLAGCVSPFAWLDVCLPLLGVSMLFNAFLFLARREAITYPMDVMLQTTHVTIIMTI